MYPAPSVPTLFDGGGGGGGGRQMFVLSSDTVVGYAPPGL
jgi:hypothetical protein